MRSFRAIAALAILILAAGCASSPTSPEPTGSSQGLYANGGG